MALQIRSPGGVNLGTTDTNLYRNNAHELKTDDSLTVAGTLTVAGEVIDVSRYVDAMFHGAVGDGNTDDTAAIQALLDDHCVVYLRPGHTFSVSTLTMTSGSGLVGEHGAGYVQVGQTPVDAAAISKLQLRAGTNASLIVVPEAASYVMIRDLELDGNDFFQSTGHVIDCPAAAGAAVELHLILDNIYAHNGKQRVLSVGAGRLNAIIFRCILTNAISEVVGWWGNDLRVEESLIGVGDGDGIKIAGDVYSLMGTEVYSCDGAGLVLEARRGAIVGCTVDRNGGHGAYIASNTKDIFFTSCVFHTNSVTTDGAANHVEVKDGASARFSQCIWTPNDDGVTNLANWCVSIDASADGVTLVDCQRDANSSKLSTTSIRDPEGIGSLVTKVTTIGQLAPIAAATTTDIAVSKVTGDVNERFILNANGTQEWGDGTNAVDVNLYRTAANHLKTDDSFTVTGTLTAGSYNVNEAVEGIIVQHEPTGFPNETDSAMSLVDNGANSTFTIAPTSTSYDVWVGGHKYTKSSPTTLTIAHTTGVVYIYYNDAGTLVQSGNQWAFETDCPVAMIYRSNTAGDEILMDERHGLVMDWATHRYLHTTIGTKWLSGLVASGYVLNGTADADNTFAVSGGSMADEDETHTVDALADGGPYTIMWRTGSTEWTWSTGIAVPLSVSATYANYNSVTGGVYSLAELAANRWVNMWLFETSAHDAEFQHILVVGQVSYTSLAAAQAASAASLALGSFPFAEALLRYKFTFHTNASYVTTGKVRLEAVEEHLGESVSIVGTVAPTSHTQLSNRDSVNQHPASSITNTPAGNIAATDVQAALNELDSEKAAASALGDYVLEDYSGYAATTTDVLRTGVTGEAAYRHILNADGKMEWGSGAGAVDTYFERSGVNTLSVSQNLVADGYVAVGGNRAQSGDLRMTRTGTLAWRNQGLNGDISVLWTDSNDDTFLNADTGNAVKICVASSPVLSVAAAGVTSAAPLAITAAATTTDAFTVKVTGDAANRFIVNGDGGLEWGSGAGATDVVLYRLGADTLYTADNFAAELSVGVGGGGLFGGGGSTAYNTIKLAFNVSGDVANRFIVDAGGTIQWGDGTNAADTNLYRSAANTLKTDDDIFTAGHIGIGTAPLTNVASAIGGTLTGASVFGTYTGSLTLTPGAAGNAYSLYGGGGSVATGTDTAVGSAIGCWIAPMIKTGGGTIASSTGLAVYPSSIGTANYGLILGAASHGTLWISQDGDNTTASAGILFGASIDTNLYRSAANSLQTDDNFYAYSLNTTAGSVTVNMTGTGGLTLQNTGVSKWYIQNRTDDSDSFRITSGAAKVAMRIGQATGAVQFDQYVAVGGGLSADIMLRVQGTIQGTGGTTYGFVSQPTAPATTTTQMFATYSQVVTTAASFTMGQAYGYYVAAPSLGANSAITTSYGVHIAKQAATGITTAYALYQADSGDQSFFGGRIGIGGAAATNRFLNIGGTHPSTETALYGQVTAYTIPATATGTSCAVYAQAPGTAAANFTANYNIAVWVPGGGTVGAGSTVTRRFGIYMDAQTGATNNYSCRLAASSTATLWLSADADNTTASAGILFGTSQDTNLYRSGADLLKTDDSLHVAGTLGVGIAPNANYLFYLGGNIPGSGAYTYGVLMNGYAPSTSTSGTLAAVFRAGTAAASFTCGAAYGIYIDNPLVGSGSTITTAYGLYVVPQTSAGTNNFGVAIGASTTCTLWLSNGANNTTAAAGIMFGSSRDTNLYRSAADELKTDDAFTAGGNISLGAAGTLFSAISSTAAATWRYQSAVSGDAQVRFYMTAAGTLTWGDGTNAADTNLYRSAANTLKTDDSLIVAGDKIEVQSGYIGIDNTIYYTTIASKVTGDADDRFKITSEGPLYWGDGTNAVDTNLYRSAANTLKTDDSLVVGGTISIGSASSGWAVTNKTEDKTLDCNGDTLAQTNDVLGTLIDVLIAKGIITA